VNSVDTVFRGKGDGTFGAPEEYATTGLPDRILIGDLNHDSWPDLVVALYADTKTNVLLGTGNGRFAPAVATGFASLLGSAVIGYFDGDDTMDLAVSGSSQVNIYRGLGNGAFESTGSNKVFGATYDVIAAELNGDTQTDLAVTGNGYVFILLGSGDGQFTATDTLVIPDDGALLDIEAADFNGDGSMDLVACEAEKNQVHIWLGTGAGQFATRKCLPCRGRPQLRPGG
jgi:hypothetical protein